VFCQIVYLRRCIPGRIRRALDELPETLDETYGRSLKEIDEQNWEYAYRLLQCVAVASRPLHVEELAEFLAFDFDAGPIPTFLADWRPEDPRHTVLSTCSSLLAVVDVGVSPVVQFAHFSVKEYLTSERLAKTKDTISRFHVSMTPAHTIFAQACVGVLLQLDENVTRESVENLPLSKYAARHWVDHARFENVASTVQNGMNHLFDPSKGHLSAWVWIHNPYNLSGQYNKDSDERPPKLMAAPLHYATSCGMHDVARFLIVEHSQDVNAQVTFWKDTPLHVASSGSYMEVVRVLLEFGADLEVKDLDGRTPLLRMSGRGDMELTRILLEHGADTEARDKHGHTPLLQTSERGHVDLARVLLEHGADTEARDDGGHSPLHVASVKGHVELALVLLKHNAHIEALDKDNCTPLILASREGHVEVAQLLIKHGAGVNAQRRNGSFQRRARRLISDRNGYTPLFWAFLIFLSFISLYFYYVIFGLRYFGLFFYFLDSIRVHRAQNPM